MSLIAWHTSQWVGEAHPQTPPCAIPSTPPSMTFSIHNAEDRLRCRGLRVSVRIDPFPLRHHHILRIPRGLHPGLEHAESLQRASSQQRQARRCNHRPSTSGLPAAAPNAPQTVSTSDHVRSRWALPVVYASALRPSRCSITLDAATSSPAPSTAIRRAGTRLRPPAPAACPARRRSRPPIP